MVNQRLTHYLEVRNLLTTETFYHLVRLQSDIKIALKTGYKVLGISVDFEKSYDMVRRQGLMFKIYKLGIDKFIANKKNMLQSMNVNLISSFRRMRYPKDQLLLQHFLICTQISSLMPLK